MRLQFVIAGADGSPLTEAMLRWASGTEAECRIYTNRMSPADVNGSDVLVSAGHHYFLGSSLRKIPRLGAIGLHPSLLPRYRGSYPLWWALRHGESTVGLSLYHLVDEIDAGPIIYQREVAVLQGDTFASLYERVAAEVAPVMDALVGYLETHGELPPGEPQDEGIATVVRTPPRWLRALMRLRWHR
jgi:methionyl-tRNA formyltransferase